MGFREQLQQSWTGEWKLIYASLRMANWIYWLYWLLTKHTHMKVQLNTNRRKKADTSKNGQVLTMRISARRLLAKIDNSWQSMINQAPWRLWASKSHLSEISSFDRQWDMKLLLGSVHGRIDNSFAFFRHVSSSFKFLSPNRLEILNWLEI